MKALLISTLLLFSVPSFAGGDDKLGYTNESSLGYVVTGGNSESETTSFKQLSVYTWKHDIVKFTGSYIQASGLVDAPTSTNPSAQESRTTAENWSATLRLERVLEPKVLNLFIAHGWYGDRFQGVREGHSTDLGTKYSFLTEKPLKLFVEAGYRYTRELLVAESTEKVGVGSAIYPEYHYARLYSQVDYSYSKSFSLGAWIEYLPSITDFTNDQRVNYSPYLTSVLTDIFSLKVSYEGRYRYKPAKAGNKLTDFTFTTSLLAKF